jgi:hypothetical protein
VTGRREKYCKNTRAQWQMCSDAFAESYLQAGQKSFVGNLHMVAVLRQILEKISFGQVIPL